MKCKIDGCDRDARYKAEQLCQLHYFRRRRGGTFEIVRKPGREVFEHTGGYLMQHAPGHPLAQKTGYVFQHRHVMYAKYGETLPPCELCGKPLSWGVVHIDHIDHDRKNNSESNLRPLCAGCNVWRDMPPLHTFDHTHSLTYGGKTDTPAGWARDPRVKVAGRTIVLRKAAGMTDEDALFSAKVTHNGRPPVDNRIRKTQFAHERSNSISIVIDGEIKTSAEWSRDARCNVSDATLRNRVKAGWPHDSNILKRIKSPDKLKALKGQSCPT